MGTLLQIVRAVIGESRRNSLLLLLFLTAFVVLLFLLMVQVREVYDVERPAGPAAAGKTGLVVGPPAEHRQVLVLNSYHIGYSWSDNELTGIIRAFREASAGVDPVIEHLDCKRNPQMEHFDRLRDLFLLKYRQKRFPIVLAVDNPALEFALQYRRTLFPGAAVVFCGINGFSQGALRSQADITGVAELHDAEGTLRSALQLQPGLRQVFVVHDYSITGRSTRRETEAQLKQFEGRVSLRYLEDMTARELTQFLRTLPADSMVLALSYSLDKEGVVFNHERISRLLSENAAVPVYGLHEERIGYGIVGGSLMGGELQGHRAAELALRILDGEAASGIPVDLKSPTRLMFDHAQLVRFRIPLDRVPKDAVIVNRPVSLLAEHPGPVFTSLGIFALLLAGIAVLGFNIYRRRLAERERQRLHDQLLHAQKMEAVGHLAGGIAHDFNNILTAIIGYANLAGKRVSDETARTFIDNILVASERAAKLVRNLLAFSRKQAIEPKPTDINEVVKGVDRLVCMLLGEDIQFTIRLHAGALTAMADSGQVEQVVVNLCTNARDAMPHGGNISIETERIEVNEKLLKLYLLERPGAYCVISVSDTGAGMDEAVRRRVFEPFYTTKDVGRGTGLGLSIAYGIIRQHNGSITVYSEPGKGTTFKVYLPLVEMTGTPAAATRSEELRGGSETVLVAEDEDDVRSLVSLVLRDAGYAVIEAADGEEAVRRFRERPGTVDLLLTDVIMPKRNGREVYEAIREESNIKVLFMSGYTADIIRSKMLFGKGFAFIAKPVVPDDLVRKVRQVLDGAHGRSKSSG